MANDPHYSTVGDIAKYTGTVLYTLARRGRGKSLAHADRALDKIRENARTREAIKSRAAEQARQAKLQAKYGKKKG
ncbi:hypothetical protein ABZ769_35430 [Streptomyces olivoreticuli]